MNLQSIRTSAYSVLATYAASNPTQITKAFKARPASFAGVPLAYVGDVRTSFKHTAGTRMWTAEVDVVVVDNLADNEEAETRLDNAAMGLVDSFTDQPHAFGDNTVGEPLGVAQTTDDVNGVPYEARVVTVGRILFTEGR